MAYVVETTGIYVGNDRVGWKRPTYYRIEGIANGICRVLVFKVSPKAKQSVAIRRGNMPIASLEN